MEYGWLGTRLQFVPVEREKHFELQYRWFNNPAVTQWTDIEEFPLSPKGVDTYLNNIELYHENPSTILFAVEKLDGTFIGLCDIRDIHYRNQYGEIGYIIGDTNQWGQGYGKEIVGMLIKYAFDMLNLRTLTAKVLSPNLASMKILEKHGFSKCGHIPSYIWRRGEYRDVFYYYLQKNKA